MNKYYNEIMQLIGAEEFKTLIKKWDNLSDNVRNHYGTLPRLLPDLLWVGNSGIGRTKLMSLMSEYLAEQGNLFNFYGDVKFFEFLLSYTPKDRPFEELRRLEDELAAAKGFRESFGGAILIDIGAWVKHYDELYFVSFMEYLSAHSDQWIIVLSVPELEKEKLNNLEAFLSMYLRLEKVTLTMPETEQLYTFVEKALEGYNLHIDHSGKELLIRTIDEMRENPYFDGFKTLKMLCQDIIYEHFSADDPSKTLLGAQDLSAFAPESHYVKKVIKDSEKVRRIGFNRGEE